MVDDALDTAALMEWVEYTPTLVTNDFVVVDKADWNQMRSDIAAVVGWVEKMHRPPGDEDA